MLIEGSAPRAGRRHRAPRRQTAPRTAQRATGNRQLSTGAVEEYLTDEQGWKANDRGAPRGDGDHWSAIAYARGWVTIPAPRTVLTGEGWNQLTGRLWALRPSLIRKCRHRHDFVFHVARMQAPFVCATGRLFFSHVVTAITPMLPCASWLTVNRRARRAITKFCQFNFCPSGGVKKSISTSSLAD
jgi:hypothetical protein